LTGAGQFTGLTVAGKIVAPIDLTVPAAKLLDQTFLMRFIRRY